MAKIADIDARLQAPIRDDEAYDERVAIVAVDWTNDLRHMDIFHIANECGYRTCYSHVASAAIRGDWLPLWQWCTRECQTFNDELAQAIMQEIREKVARELEWRRRLYSQKR